MKNNFATSTITDNAVLTFDVRGFERIQAAIAWANLSAGNIALEYSMEFETPTTWRTWQTALTFASTNPSIFKEADLCFNWLRISVTNMAGAGKTLTVTLCGRGV